MTRGTSVIVLFILLNCCNCFGQSSFKGLTPGKSAKADVERVLGQPVREISETLSEYKADSTTQQIFVQYRRATLIVERIEVVYPGGIARAAALRSLNLTTPSASQTNARGKFQE